MTDEMKPGEPESATILYISDRCPLCGGPLATVWPGADVRKCKKCGGRIKQGTVEESGFR